MVRSQKFVKKKNHKLTLARQSRLQPASSSPTWVLSLDAKALGDSFGLSGESSPSWLVEAALFGNAANQLIASSPE